LGDCARIIFRSSERGAMGAIFVGPCVNCRCPFQRQNGPERAVSPTIAEPILYSLPPAEKRRTVRTGHDHWAWLFWTNSNTSWRPTTPLELKRAPTESFRPARPVAHRQPGLTTPGPIRSIFPAQPSVGLLRQGARNSGRTQWAGAPPTLSRRPQPSGFPVRAAVTRFRCRSARQQFGGP